MNDKTEFTRIDVILEYYRKYEVHIYLNNFDGLIFFVNRNNLIEIK